MFFSVYYPVNETVLPLPSTCPYMPGMISTECPSTGSLNFYKFMLKNEKVHESYDCHSLNVMTVIQSCNSLFDYVVLSRYVE